jgi:hypothetical protein
MRLGIGFLKGTYNGTIRVTDRAEPHLLTLEVHGSGLLGSLTASGTIHLREAPNGTDLAYDGDAAIGGRVGALGERVIAATAERLIGAFFDCVASRL